MHPHAPGGYGVLGFCRASNVATTLAINIELEVYLAVAMQQLRLQFRKLRLRLPQLEVQSV